MGLRVFHRRVWEFFTEEFNTEQVGSLGRDKYTLCPNLVLTIGFIGPSLLAQSVGLRGS